MRPLVKPIVAAALVLATPAFATAVTYGGPRTAAGVGAVANAGGAPALQEGLASGLGPAGTFGRLYYATDTNVLYRDNGTNWFRINTYPLGGTAGVTASGGPVSLSCRPNASANAPTEYAANIEYLGTLQATNTATLSANCNNAGTTIIVKDVSGTSDASHTISVAPTTALYCGDAATSKVVVSSARGAAIVWYDGGCWSIIAQYAASGGSGTVASVSGPTGITWANSTTTPTGSWSGGYAGQNLFGPDPALGLGLVWKAVIFATGTTFTADAGSTYAAAGTGTGATSANGNTAAHPYLKLTSGSTASGNYEEVSGGTALVRTAFSPRFVQQLRSDATITSQTVWVALVDTSIAAQGVQPSTTSVAYTHNMFGAAYDPSVDSHWLVCDSSSGTGFLSCTASTVTYSASTDYTIACDINRTTATTTTCTFNGVAAANTSNQPTGFTLVSECGVVTRTTASAIVSCGAVYLFGGL